MVETAAILFWTGVGFLLYTYALYPGLLKLLALRAPAPPAAEDPDPWPTVSLSLPVFNEEHQIAQALESLLALDYPRDRLQILVVSDGSSDRTDEIVRAYADRGVELLRMPEHRGRVAAEAAATRHLDGEIVVSTGASIRIVPDALKLLVRGFSDGEVGLTSGRVVSVTAGGEHANEGEVKYVGYEMVVRGLEARVGSFVGAPRALYAIRDHLHSLPLPQSSNRSDAAVLHCRERGYRAVFVPEAVCYVPRASSLGQEYERKVRVVTRGIRTLLHKRHLLNPIRYGLFSWMLFSHRVCRWAAPWAGLVALLGLAMMAPGTSWGRWVLAAAVAGLVLGALGWRAADRGGFVRPLAVPAFLLMGNLAAAHGLLRVMRGDRGTLPGPSRGDSGSGE